MIAAPPAEADDFPKNRGAIRLLFGGFILLFLAALTFRQLALQEPYPGPFMPSFAGTGLDTWKYPDNKLTLAPEVTVTFADHTTATPSASVLLANFPESARASILFDIFPSPLSDVSGDATTGPVGRLRFIRLWLINFFPKLYPSLSTTSGAIPSDIHLFLVQRLGELYPSKKPLSLTLTVAEGKMVAGDFHHLSRHVLRQETLSLDEGS